MMRESRLFITSMTTDRIGRHKVLLPINHKNYNFREKKKLQVMKERENLQLKTGKGGLQSCKLFNVALKERKPHFRSLYMYTVSTCMVIESKVVIGGFKLRL